MRYTVKYSELYKQLIGLILIPLTLAAIFIFGMYLFKWLVVSETFMNVYTIAGSCLVVLLGIFLARKFIMVDADVEYDMNGIHIQLKNANILYKQTAFSLHYNNIQNITFDENDNYRVYVKISTLSPKKTIFISPDNYNDNASFISYWSDVTKKIN